MKTHTYHNSLTILTIAILLLGVSGAHAGRRAYGVSTDRGSAVATRRGVAWSGDNSSGVVTRRGGAIATDNGVAVARRPVAGTLPRGYIRTVPVNYRRVVYGGYNCYFVGGIYYRAVMYQGATVYVVVS